MSSRTKCILQCGSGKPPEVCQECFASVLADAEDAQSLSQRSIALVDAVCRYREARRDESGQSIAELEMYTALDALDGREQGDSDE